MKAVIVAAGYGTRFLPITKSVPKEMMPLYDTPILEYIVKELSDAGVEEILIVISKCKKMIKQYFTRNIHLEKFLIERNKMDLMEQVTKQQNYAKISFAYQKKIAGFQDAINCARKFVGKDNFILCTGDDVFVNENGDNCALQMIKEYNKTKTPLIITKTVDESELHKYGVIKYAKNGENNIESIVEKPKTDFPSNDIVVGRYFLPAKIFEYIKQNNTARINGELNFTECLNMLAKNEGLNAVRLQGTSFDTGDKKGYAKAFAYFTK